MEYKGDSEMNFGAGKEPNLNVVLKPRAIIITKEGGDGASYTSQKSENEVKTKRWSNGNWVTVTLVGIISFLFTLVPLHGTKKGSPFC